QRGRSRPTCCVQTSSRSPKVGNASGSPSHSPSTNRRHSVDRPLEHRRSREQDGRVSRFGVLGPMAVHGGDGEIPIPGPRLRTLLALLLAEPNRVIGAAALAAALWEDRPPQNADRTILTYLSRLRRTLDAAHAGATIVTRSAGYALQVDPGAID